MGFKEGSGREMIKEYKLPGLYVLGVPEKSLISFVTFSLSLFVLTISYLLYFYFRGCPVELALVPPVDKLGDPVEITYDGVNELADIKSEEIADKIVQDAITPDPGEKQSLVSRFFGIFKKTSKNQNLNWLHQLNRLKKLLMNQWYQKKL